MLTKKQIAVSLVASCILLVVIAVAVIYSMNYNFNQDYAFSRMEISLNNTHSGALLVALDDGSFYQVIYTYEDSVKRNPTYKDTNKNEITSLMKYISFDRTDFTLWIAAKYHIEHDSDYAPLFDNETIRESFQSHTNSSVPMDNSNYQWNLELRVKTSYENRRVIIHGNGVSINQTFEDLGVGSLEPYYMRIIQLVSVTR